jgi:hypothetical protein
MTVAQLVVEVADPLIVVLRRVLGRGALSRWRLDGLDPPDVAVAPFLVRLVELLQDLQGV